MHHTSIFFTPLFASQYSDPNLESLLETEVGKIIKKFIFELWRENSTTSKVSYHKTSQTLPSLSVNGVRLNEAMLCRKRINGQFSGKNLSLHNSQHKSYGGGKTRLFRSVRTTQNCSHIELCVHTFPTTRDSQEVISTTAKGPHFGTSPVHQRRAKPRSTNNISLDALK